MPPKARSLALSGTGRAKRAAAPEPAVTSKVPAKRGRPAQAEAVEAVELAAEPPKKRGRPAKVHVLEAPAPTTRIGRPCKTEAIVDEAVAVVPRKRAGRPRKEAPIQEAPATPKRGRPAKAPALDLSRIVVSLRTQHAAAAARRIDPRVRSRLRTRLPPAHKLQQHEPVRQPAKRGRGRPKTPTATTAIVKPSKPAAPRKKRGYTNIEVPDKFAAQIMQTLQALVDAEASGAAPIDKENLDVEQQDADGDEEEHADLNHAVFVHEEDMQQNNRAEHGQDFEDEFSGDEAEPVYQVEAEAEDELSMQEVVQADEIAEHYVSFQQEVHERLVLRDGSADDVPLVLDDDDSDDFVREPSRPSAGAIFG